MRSYPPSLIFRRGEGGHDNLLVESYVKKPDSGFFSDWSRNNAYETLPSYWLLYFNLISGQKVGLARSKQNGGDSEILARKSFDFSAASVEALRNFHYDSLKVEQTPGADRVLTVGTNLFT